MGEMWEKFQDLFMLGWTTLACLGLIGFLGFLLIHGWPTSGLIVGAVILGTPGVAGLGWLTIWATKWFARKQVEWEEKAKTIKVRGYK